MTNSADLDQLATSEANGSGSALFAKTGHVVFSKRRFKRSLPRKERIFFKGRQKAIDKVSYPKLCIFP